jgi:hypothetical protein
MKDKEIIEEMAQCKNFSGMTCSKCKVRLGCDRYTLAEELYEQGYQKSPKIALCFQVKKQKGLEGKRLTLKKSNHKSARKRQRRF